MWINTNTGKVLLTHSDIRQDCRGASFPSEMTNEMVGNFGYQPVTVVTPVFNKITQSATESAPVKVAGAWTQQWTITALTAAAAASNLAAEKLAFTLQIDVESDSIVRAVIGERASQYSGAEKEASAYKAANYTGAVPPKVQAWATAKNQTAAWAADSQLATAAAWRPAEDDLYAKRLLLKENARNAIDATALDAAKTAWAAFLVVLKGRLGL